MVVTLTVETFDKGSQRDKARKVCEEAMEFYAAYEKFADNPCHETDFALLLEIGDVFTALANFCAAEGISPQTCVTYAQTKNMVRGYYGNPLEVALQWQRDMQGETSSE